VTRILPSENYLIQKCCFKNALLPVKLPSSFVSFFHYYERTQVLCSTKVAWKRLALRHSRNIIIFMFCFIVVVW